MKQLSLLFLVAFALTSSSCAFLVLGIGGALSNDFDNASTSYIGALPYQATSDEYAEKFADQMEENSRVFKTWYHYTVEILGDSIYLVKTFQPDTKQITELYSYDYEALWMKNGACKEWWDNGQVNFEGEYKANQKAGLWSYFDHDTGKKTSSGYFRKGVKEGKWTFFDKNTTQKIAEVNYSNNEKNGPFQLFENEKLIAKGTYFQNEVNEITWEEGVEDAQKEYFEKNRALNLKETSLKMSYLKSCAEFDNDDERKTCTENELLQHIYKNIKYPIIAREMGIEGLAIISFNVNTEGKIVDVDVRKGLCKEITTECRRVVEIFAEEWVAGQDKGEKVKVRYNLPIRFRLEQSGNEEDDQRENG